MLPGHRHPDRRKLQLLAGWLVPQPSLCNICSQIHSGLAAYRFGSLPGLQLAAMMRSDDLLQPQDEGRPSLPYSVSRWREQCAASSESTLASRSANPRRSTSYQELEGRAHSKGTQPAPDRLDSERLRSQGVTRPRGFLPARTQLLSFSMPVSSASSCVHLHLKSEFEVRFQI